MTRSLGGALLALAMMSPISAGTPAAAADESGGLDPLAVPALSSAPGGVPVAPALTRLGGSVVTVDTSGAECVVVSAAALAKPVHCIEVTRLSTGTRPWSGQASDDAGAAAPAATGSSAATAADDNGGFPDVCRTTSTQTTGGAYQAVDRRNACTHERFFIVVRDIRTGAITGTSQLEAVIKMQSSRTTSRWIYTINLAISFATGNGAPTMSTGRLVACPFDCDVAIPGTYSSNGIDSWFGTGQVDVPVQDIKEDIVPGNWHVVFTNPTWLSAARFQFGSPATRCDDVIGNRAPGCVFAAVPGIMGYSQSEFPEFTSHVSRAQISGLPGRFGSGTFLTYLTSTSERDSNGNRACPSSLSRPAGKSCDEYPFRSTHEGAATSPLAGDSAHKARTFDGCSMPSAELGRTGPAGWSHCFIKAEENSLAGSRLGVFYSDERLLEDDPFQVGFRS